MNYEGYITKLAAKYFGSSWHEKFNKSGKKLEEVLKFKTVEMRVADCSNFK